MDHGYHLGEHGIWCKVTNFEAATRVPLVISVPGQFAPGAISDALVELLDVYPTLAELAGLTPPRALQGKSLVPLLESSQGQGELIGKSIHKAAYSQIFRPDSVMGISMRTDAWRITEWVAFDYLTGTPDWSNVTGTELYSHIGDPTAYGVDGRKPAFGADDTFDSFENVNLAENPAYADWPLQYLKGMLRNGPWLPTPTATGLETTQGGSPDPGSSINFE